MTTYSVDDGDQPDTLTVTGKALCPSHVTGKTFLERQYRSCTDALEVASTNLRLFTLK